MIAEFACVPARCKRVFPRRIFWWLGGCLRGCITGCVDVCVGLCVDIWMPDLRLEVCVVEPPRVLVLDNWAVCRCVSEARVPVMTGLLCVFSFWTCRLSLFVCARSHV